MKICNEDCFNCEYPDCIQGLSTKQMPTGNTFGDRLKRERLLAGLRQKDVADKIGVKVNTVSTWENNRSTPSKEYMDKIMSVFPRARDRG